MSRDHDADVCPPTSTKPQQKIAGKHLCAAMETALRSCAVRELRNLAEAHKISLFGAVEKQEVVNILLEALTPHEIEQFLSDPGQKATPSAASSMAEESTLSTAIRAVADRTG